MPLVLLPQSTSEKSQSSSSLQPPHRQPKLPVRSTSEPSFLMQTRASSLSLPLCAPAFHQSKGPPLGPHHTHQWLFWTGQTRRGHSSPDAVTKGPNKRGGIFFVRLLGFLLAVCCPLLRRTPSEAARRDLKDKIQHFFLAELLLQIHCVCLSKFW